MKSFASYSLNVGGKLVEFDRPIVMGIVNVTPDSFYAGSRTPLCDVASVAAEMVRQGADIIDVGGCSTRPGSVAPTLDEELRRVIPAVKTIREALPDTLISIDTFRSAVAREALTAGADIINDVGTTEPDGMTPDDIAAMKAPYILTHSCPLDASLTAPDEVAAAVVKSLAEKLSQLTLAGVADVIVDPGFGFGKTLEQNYVVFATLPLLETLNCPVLVGISRKSMIYKALGITPDESLCATTALNFAALERGVAILRVHDVAAARQAISLYQLLLQGNPSQNRVETRVNPNNPLLNNPYHDQ